MWITTYAVEHMLWRTMSMLPTPYAYGVDNTYAVDDVVYTVDTCSVGDMLWNHDHIPWATHAVGM